MKKLLIKKTWNNIDIHGGSLPEFKAWWYWEDLIKHLGFVEAGDFVTDPQQTLSKYLLNEKGGLKI